MSISRPAVTSVCAMQRSAAKDDGSPIGWLCASTSAAGHSGMARRNSLRARENNDLSQYINTVQYVANADPMDKLDTVKGTLDAIAARHAAVRDGLIALFVLGLEQYGESITNWHPLAGKPDDQAWLRGPTSAHA